MEVNKKQLADIFGASIRTIQNWQEQGMPVLRGGGKGNEVLYDSAAVIKWYAESPPVVVPYCLRSRTALNRTPTAPAHPVRIWVRKPHRRLITALNPRITSGRIRTV